MAVMVLSECRKLIRNLKKKGCLLMTRFSYRIGGRGKWSFSIGQLKRPK